MATVPDLFTFHARLATFTAPIEASKRRVSATKKKPSKLTWPHKTPSAEQLAKAGFYYKPSTTNTDSVTCFLCSRSLDGWEPEDDPAAEHLAHVPDCAWAINMGIESRLDRQEAGEDEENPRGDKMMEARRATFADKWPHEDKKGWKCKVQKMVDAGWSYEPLPEADDCVKCFYCRLCLDGWEPKDDPWEEHQRRSPDCQFFTLVAHTKKETKIKTSRRSSRMSTTSRLSTVPITAMEVDMEPSMLLDETVAEEGDTVLSTTTGAKKKPAKGRKRAGTATRSKAVGKSNSKQNTSEVPDSDQPLPAAKETETLVSGVESKGRHTSPVVLEQFVLLSSIVSPLPPAETSSQPKRTVRRKADKKETKANQDVTELESEVLPSPAPRVVVKATKRTKQKLDEPTMLDSSVVALESEPPQPKPARLVRGKKRTSDGNEKIATPVQDLAPLKSSVPEQHAPRPDLALQNVAHISKEISQDSPMFKALPQESSRKVRKLSANLEASAKRSEGRELADVELVKVPASNKPILVREDSRLRGNTPEAVTADQEEDEVRTPARQESDTENLPPSSRPSLEDAAAVAMSSPKPHLTPLKPSTPLVSPSKRTLHTDKLHSSIPWQQTDLETVFLPSPRSADGIERSTTIEQALTQLTESEKQMSVGDWILWNAKAAEGRLKDECERLINVFESEGVRALAVVEGIECT